MYLVYIDDSGDEKVSVFSALAVPDEAWRACFDELKAYRQSIRDEHGVYMKKELHAWEFISGRGKYGPERISIEDRVKMFFHCLNVVADLPGVRLFNACRTAKEQDRTFERLVNRIERTLKEWDDSLAILISDEGKEGTYRKMLRRMSVYNPIPSKYFTWESGKVTKNIPVQRVIEDIVFKKSELSYFIQAVDFSAYALLRHENERPLASKTKYGLHKAHYALDPICVKEASPRDPRGVIR